MKFSLTFSDLTADEVGRLIAQAGANPTPAAQPAAAWQPPQGQGQMMPPAQTAQMPAQPAMLAAYPSNVPPATNVGGPPQQAYQPPAPPPAMPAMPPQPGPGELTPAHVQPAMQNYNNHYKVPGLQAVFARLGLPPNLSACPPDGLRRLKAAFESMLPPDQVPIIP